jgi:hypothetical protein
VQLAWLSVGDQQGHNQYLQNVEREVIPPEHKAEAAKPGFHFGVTRMPGENFVAPGHYAEIANSSQLPAAAVQLAWLSVGDQQGHNQYLQNVEREEQGVAKKTKHFKLIDMGQMFGNFTWTAASLANVHTTYQLPAHMIPHLTKVKLQPTFDQLAAVADAMIEECFLDCPETWNVPDADKAAGARYAIQAKKVIADIVFKGNPGIQ